MKKFDLIRFRRGARNAFAEHYEKKYDQKTKKNLFEFWIVFGTVFSLLFIFSIFIEEFLYFLSLFMEVSVKEIPKIEKWGIFAIFLFIFIILPYLLAIRNWRGLKPVKSCMNDLHSWQKEKGFYKGLKSFLSQNVQFRDNEFFQEWLDIFKNYK